MTTTPLRSDIETLQRQCAIGYLYIMIANLLLLAYTSFPLLVSSAGLFLGLITLMHIIALPLMYLPKLTHEGWRWLFSCVVGVSMMALCPMVVFLQIMGITTPYLYIFVAPIGIFVFFPTLKASRRNMFLVIFLAYAICLWSFSHWLGELFKKTAPTWYINWSTAPSEMTFRNHLAVIQGIIIGGLLLYYFMQYYVKINTLLLMQQTKVDEEIREPAGGGKAEDYDGLYRRIIAYFDAEEPYLQSSFSITQLSLHLGTNIVYASKAINRGCNMSFSSLVAKYRVEKVKSMIRAQGDVYKMEHIYKCAGFVTQSTFNKAFKQIEGLTPSEYAESVYGDAEEGAGE